MTGGLRAHRLPASPSVWWLGTCAVLALIIVCTLWVDGPVSDVARPLGNHSFLRQAAGIVRPFGKGWVQVPVLLVLAVGAAARGSRRWTASAVRGLVALTASASLVEILKLLVRRARPIALDDPAIASGCRTLIGAFHVWSDGLLPLHHKSGLIQSFPSAEAAAGFALAAVFSAAAPRVRPLFLLFAVAVAMERVILRQHFVSDVLAGATLGWVVGAGCVRWLPRQTLNVSDRSVPTWFSRHSQL